MLFAWVLIVVVALGACSAVSPNTDVELKAPGEAGEAFDLFQERFGVQEEAAQEIASLLEKSRSIVNKPRA